MMDLASMRSEEHTSELQSRGHLVCRLLLEKKRTSAEPHPRRPGGSASGSPPLTMSPPNASTGHNAGGEGGCSMKPPPTVALPFFLKKAAPAEFTLFSPPAPPRY